jgi:hypothetical protein
LDQAVAQRHLQTSRLQVARIVRQSNEWTAFLWFHLIKLAYAMHRLAVAEWKGANTPFSSFFCPVTDEIWRFISGLLTSIAITSRACHEQYALIAAKIWNAILIPSAVFRIVPCRAGFVS